MSDDEDDLTRAFGPLAGDDPAPRPAEPRTLGRILAGTPRMWQGVVFSALGLVWLALLGFGFEWLRLVIGVVWLVLGGMQLTVALSDRARRRGAYSRGD